MPSLCPWREVVAVVRFPHGGPWPVAGGGCHIRSVECTLLFTAPARPRDVASRRPPSPTAAAAAARAPRRALFRLPVYLLNGIALVLQRLQHFLNKIHLIK